jgi:hypothetical protein
MDKILIAEVRKKTKFGTDGGFKYSGENENWLFETEAHWYDIV